MENKKTAASGQDRPDPAVRKKKHKTRRIILSVIGVLLAVFVLIGCVGLYYLHLWRSGQWQPSAELKEKIKSLAESTEMMQYARDLKADLKDLASALKEQDPDAAETAREQVHKDARAIRRYMDSPLFLAASLAPGLGDELASVRELLDVLDEADGALIGPYIELLKTAPLSEVNTDEGIRVDALLQYLDFLETALPEAESLIERVNGLDLSVIDSEGKIASYLDQLNGLLETGASMQDYLPAIRTVLGDGSDRLYIFAAQNSSEIRASGGFPGSVGTIRIRDGLLTISDFKSVYKVFQQFTPARAEITTVEDVIFNGRLRLAWDSDFSPDFERVAYIWSVSYEDRNGEKVDGVISGTPAIIQRMLSFLGSITLSDGTELNGDNASRVLGHDLYFRYFGSRPEANAANIVDDLFAEAAKETMSRLFSQMNARMFANFFTFFQESIADRTLMVWMADPDEQELIRKAGWNAGMNTDPMRPQAGVFFNSTAASKVAWFLNIEPELSEPVRNEDGSTSYELTVRFVNVMTPEERAQAGGYILGGTGGITGSMYVFAPAGGTVSDAYTESGYTMRTANYEGLDLVYLIDWTIVCQEAVVVHCTITTAPGAEEPLTLIVTPTMQDYR